MTLQTEFIEHIPEKMEQGVLYVSMTHSVAIHLCACGCGEEVITPLHPKTGWILTYDGVGTSLRPSIGNWNFPCHSHYFISRNSIDWCPKWMNIDWYNRQNRDNNFKSGRYNDEKPKSKKWEWPKIKKKKTK